uniref:Uncharacterized protein n=1 Tax=uncultured marine virus TaxID=186617 RepID=A0A0F7L7Z1_9VIRU|nr:hypothetical protein [uncultured marine virus]
MVFSFIVWTIDFDQTRMTIFSMKRASHKFTFMFMNRSSPYLTSTFDFKYERILTYNFCLHHGFRNAWTDLLTSFYIGHNIATFFIRGHFKLFPYVYRRDLMCRQFFYI